MKVERWQGILSDKSYEETLLGDATATAPVVDSANPNRVIVEGLAMITEGRPDLFLDLTGNSLRTKDRFYCPKGKVKGLKYVQRIESSSGKDLRSFGSYAPKSEIQSYTTPPEEMPSGMMCRGKYDVKSLFTDDDKHEHLKWEWTFELVKEWEGISNIIVIVISRCQTFSGCPFP
ncbi:rho GDP-dissociation inhibitor 2-like [Tetranychus urticae]|uniref:rho GDP-dissociation inhibitor 2-like n=1 Tax=Tetranychus urticae TaxID=32264 RepID=UPI000D646E2D|nr:rho GDP-dissociation inhibitor 2-like [Tetranychus urticae]